MTEARPPRHRVRYALVALAGFTALGLFFASRTYLLYNSYPENSVTWARALGPALLDWYSWALLFPALLGTALRFRFEPGRVGVSLAAHVAVGLAVAAVKMLLDNYALSPLLGGRSMPFGMLVMRNLQPNLLTVSLLFGLVHGVTLYRRFREREVRAARLETRLAEARLQALRMQLHPHFLFNALNGVSTLMHRDVEAAEGMLARLSDLLRATIDREGGQEVTLREELEFLDLYLEIERLRFADRLRVEIDAPPETLDGRVPHLTLQPLVENAIRHGIAPRSGPGTVEIRAARRDGMLELTVRDDGRGLDASARRPSRTNGRGGVGLANTRARLEALYGAAHRFTLRPRATGGVEVVLAVPYRTVPGESASVPAVAPEEEP